MIVYMQLDDYFEKGHIHFTTSQFYLNWDCPTKILLAIHDLNFDVQIKLWYN